MSKPTNDVKNNSTQIDHKRKLPSNILVFSHLRWDFVFQRPQHLLTRFSKIFNVYFLEEPVFENIPKAFIHQSIREENLYVLVPHIPEGLSEKEVLLVQEMLVSQFLKEQSQKDFAFWYYTPMALEYSRNFDSDLIIYDCMDELSNFKFAPLNIKKLEQELFRKAHVVFTGGYSLYEAKQHQHQNIHAFPSSIDKQHFEKSRTYKKAPKDQVDITKPRIGFFGVIDERFDIDLIAEMAVKKPQWQFILIGPVVKIDPASLPHRENLFYLGSKTYLELPEYLSGWDIALIPFLLNESTQFISPTKTPEYLAAGIPVVSTPIKDVVRPYGAKNLVHIATNSNEFISAIEKELEADKEKWLAKVDEFLMQNSWDLTCSRMLQHIEKAIKINKESNINISTL